MSSKTGYSSKRTINNLAAFQVSAALRAAIELDLFTAIAVGHDTPQALATYCRAHPRGTRILADYLVMNGYLVKSDLRYALTDEARIYLDRSSPNYLSGAIEFLQAPFLRAQFDNLTQHIRDGGTKATANVLEPNHEMWVRFARSMAPEMAFTAALLVEHVNKILLPADKPQKILDVAASHGLFGIAFLKDNPHCRVVAQDWPAILEVARENAHKHGVPDRLTTLPGNVMEIPLGTDYDAVLIPNLLHFFDQPTNIELLRKARAALKPGGLIAIVEFAPNEDRLSPISQASMAIFMLATTPAGDVYTVAELSAMLFAAGFTQIVPAELGNQRLITATAPQPQPPLVVSGTHWHAANFRSPSLTPQPHSPTTATLPA